MFPGYKHVYVCCRWFNEVLVPKNNAVSVLKVMYKPS